MTIESTIVSTLSSVASGRVYPSAAPQDAVTPIVIFRVVQIDPLMTLQGPTGDFKTTFMFESWASTLSSAVSTRASVQSALDGAFSTLGGYMEQPGEVNYDPDTDQHMAPCIYSFWHR